ncbi:hypothetical protein, partial [Mesorhizobium sp. M7A.F.Ca.US.014.04.1.1]|uniref:hypothetical protein n=1 Tax=Mesorhizobium sp. M7A.F.Ca.US.014.04.1.1 TaxID=2496744 RepID=UPI0019D012DB
MSGTFWVPPLAKPCAVEVSGRVIGAAGKFSKGKSEPRGGSDPLRSLGGNVEGLGFLGCIWLRGFRLQFG